jgi:hypothetical protein
MNTAFELLNALKPLAAEYYKLTGKPLGVTGEVAEAEAAQALGLTLAEARQAGFDATDKAGRRIQIKGRKILNKKALTGRVSKMNLADDFDVAMLVLLDPEYNAYEIYEADRGALVTALTVPGSKARNERGSLAISKFRSIGKLVWQRHQ